MIPSALAIMAEIDFFFRFVAFQNLFTEDKMDILLCADYTSATMYAYAVTVVIYPT